MREIVLDTETTGLDPRNGDRVVEIGCVELVNHIPTGQTFHVYINPERTMPRGAYDVHGLSDDFLKDKPLFREVANEFASFIEDAKLVIHNASFDVAFLNAEFARLSMPQIINDRVVDTLMLARRRHPAGPNSLDALCARYGIDNSRRTRHGALLDSELLAEVYVELIGGKQAALGLTVQSSTPPERTSGAIAVTVLERPASLAPRLTAEEIAAHESFVTKLGEGAIWLKYRSKTSAD